ncbi:MAG: hypothetical protein CMB11_03460 [Euryarchaeota archaeon]|nr:hypothetical protein [Euryarchaeota archaeon]
MSKETPAEMRSLLVTRESRIPTIVAMAVTVVMLTVTMSDFVGDLRDTDAFLTTSPSWAISFQSSGE